MWYIIILVIGMLFGSFGSVILHRLGHEITWKRVRSVLVGRSHCPHCEHTLARYDLFPLLSWLLSGGKCRYCGTRISKWYPLLELGCGLLFLGIYHRWMLYGGGDLVLLTLFLFINWAFYLLMVHDIKTMYLHPVARWFSLIGGVILLFYQNTPIEIIAAAQWIFVFGLGFLAFYWLAKGYVRLRRKQDAEGIGQGDVMVAPIIGVVIWKIFTLMTGVITTSWIAIVQYFWYYVIAACVAALLLLFITPITTEGEKRMVPFFPGMMVGVWIMMVILPWIIAFMIG